VRAIVLGDSVGRIGAGHDSSLKGVLAGTNQQSKSSLNRDEIFFVASFVRVPYHVCQWLSILLST
jgi:hypothetical protein